MSDSGATVVGDVVRVLVVGESDRIDATATALSSAFEPVSLLRERTVADARQRLAATDVHCLVCAYDRSGEESPLDRLLEADGDVPIVAVTDESFAEAAIEAGATDVIDPSSPGRLVATRVRNAAERYRLETEATGPTERRYRSILEGSTALVCVVDESGAIDYVNPAVDDRMGYTPAELERTTLFRLVHPDDRSLARETLSAAADGSLGATERTTLRLGHADGTWHVSDLAVVNRESDPNVDGLVVTVTNATPDGLADDALADAIDRLDAAFFAVGSRWELQLFNERASALFTAATPEPGTVVWDALPESVRGEFADRLREAAATGSAVAFETTHPAVDERLVVEAHPSESGVSVTARPGAEATTPAAERERLEQFEAIVDALEDGIAVLEGSTITDANPALFDLADAETLVGRDIETLVDDDLAAGIRERADSPLVRWMEPLTGTLETDGDRRPVDVSVVSLGSADGDRTCCVVRDRRGSPSAAVSTLAKTATSLRRAESRPDVREAIVDAVGSYSAADVVVWYEVDESVIRPASVSASAPGDADLPTIDRRDDPFAGVLDADGASVADPDELEPVLLRSGIRAERVLTVPIDGAGILLATSSDPMGFEGIDLAPIETLATMAATALDWLAAESRRRTLERGRADFEGLVERADAVLDLERDLFAASTRPAVEQRLASGLVDLDTGTGSIELAWIGEAAVGSDAVTLRTWAGRDGSHLESLSLSVDPETGEPAGRTAASREPTLVEDLEAVEPDRWQRLALERDFHAVMSVPLGYDELSYGTVTVYADRPGAFDERTRAICEHLATVAGYVITAIERKRALVSDSVTELEVAVPAESDPLTMLADRLDRRLDVRTVVPRSSGGTTVFCTIPDADEAAIRDAVAAIDAIERSRFVGDGATDSLVELGCAGETVAETLAEHGAILRSLSPSEDRSRLVIDLSSTVDVRSFVGMLDRKFSGAELTARREHDRTGRADRSFDAELRDQLSERQLRTLEAAYYSGFFEWPRESTGEEVAESIGVSQPTFSRHFRLAQQKVFTLLFEESDGTTANET
ncbi:bacterio-opsin activator domain-containing protein [Halosolutus amylolyticus]|uniref:Bacterio-opsin activator domain-containing protein n=1 Tax=Halosolutus amylolyticus TaxID=2932267 RepID=A0ABD5PN68_9EURY|nr:bacterio-opsin activator domain-containing protein [Halosolutus amylolyticus]